MVYLTTNSPAMRKMLFIFIVSCSALACGKNKNKQYTTWYINGEIGYSRAVSQGAGADNGLSLGWKLSSPLRAGYVGISTNSAGNNPAIFVADLYREGDYYRLSIHNSDSMLVSYADGKTRYEPAPVLFDSFADAGDSIVISGGAFDEP